MTLFLTSHIGGSERVNGKRVPSSLLQDNGFVEKLKERWPEQARILLIAADPTDHEKTDSMKACFLYAFPHHTLAVAQFEICDSRAEATAADLTTYDVIILSGGHVPTQNAFFQKLGLRDKIAGFTGILIGISAGTMNCAETVYAHPELPGEAVDSEYPRFLPGLGLTKKMVLPHYQMIKDDVLDGLRVFEDIAYPDSMGREFYALCDGSYILCENGTETLYGEAYRIRDGKIENVCCGSENLPL